MTLNLVELGTSDRDRIAAHLLRLSEADRSLRFAAGVVTDMSIRGYVAGMRFGSDAIIGTETSDGYLVGLAHGCVFMASGQTLVETAFTTDADWRRQGICTELMHAVEMHARKRGAHRLVGMCLVRNLPMRAIFGRSGMALTRVDDEMHACRALDVDPSERVPYLMAA